jgi:altronate dehydratase
VPTLKFVSTTARHELLHNEMDVDAGRYLTGTPMDSLTNEALDLTIRPATGALVEERDEPLPGQPLLTKVVPGPSPELTLLEADGRRTPEHVALVLPTSLCSGQIALRLGDTVSRVVALPHTEGCGASAGPSEETFARLMVGYLTHPNVRLALLLEHGCEKTHNDYFRARVPDPSRFGWASIQRDGGITAVTERVRTWFESATRTAPTPVHGTLSSPRLVPLAQVTTDAALSDVDAHLTGDADEQARQALELLTSVSSREHVPCAVVSGNVGF